jgi:glycosyltransferase involved in cell wall biosynthesis
MTAAITIAIPFRSNRNYLAGAIESVRRQTVADWELLVSDDSEDEAGIAELVAAIRDPRISYHRNDLPLGMSGNYNRCLDLARTELVTLCHGDDELLPNYCELMLGAASRHGGAVACFCAAKIIDENGRPRFHFPDYVKRFLLPTRGGPVVLRGEAGLRAILRGDFIMCPTLCYRKSLLGQRRFALEWRCVQDLELIARFLLEGEMLVGLPESGYAYRRHPENSTKHYTESLLRFHEERALYELLLTWAAARRWRSAARVARHKGIVKLHLAYRLLGDLCRLQGRRAWPKARLLHEFLFS